MTASDACDCAVKCSRCMRLRLWAEATWTGATEALDSVDALGALQHDGPTLTALHCTGFDSVVATIRPPSSVELTAVRCCNSLSNRYWRCCIYVACECKHVAQLGLNLN